MNHNSISDQWKALFISTLKSGADHDKILALDFLSQQSSLSAEFCGEIFPLVKDNILNPDNQIRYFARKARNHLLDCYPEIEPAKAAPQSLPIKIEEGKPLTAEQILLHKLRLGSRYVVFEALERLTESQDPAIVAPLLEFLAQETDEYKISYAIKVIGRIDDPQIPEVLSRYLEHEDPRIVANALESLSNFDVPDNVEKLTEFALSSDNRIRANAIKGLHRYDPNLAEKHIAEMIHSNNIALQASGVYLLKVLRPANLADLLEVAHQSRFATVRINALDIAPPSSEELEINKLKASEDIEQPNPGRDLFLMEIFLLIGAFMMLVSETRNKHLLSVTFLAFAVVIMAMHEKARTSVQKMALSMGFISSLAWGNTRLLVLPALMGLWLTWTGNHVNKSGKLEKARPESIFAWFFALGAIIITQLIQNELSLIMNLAQKLVEASAKVPQAVQEVVDRQGRFELSAFVMVSIMTIIIMKMNDWFPVKAEQNPRKRLTIATVICLLIILIMNLSHVFGVNLHFKISKLDNGLQMIKQLIP